MSSSDNDDVETGKEEVTYDVQEKKSFRKRIGEHQSCFTFCCGILVVLLFIIVKYFLEKTHYETKHGISASLLAGHSSHNRKSCDYYDYGCCNIYYNCRVVNGKNFLDFRKNPISVYKIVSEDNIDSNCPSLRTIINEYNEHYGNATCGEHGCCPDFDVTCDDVVHDNIHNGNNEKLVEKYREHIGTKMKITVPKVDERGSNCWNNDGWMNGINHFKEKYENGYPKDEEMTVLEYIFIILLVIAFICWLLDQK